MKNKKICCFFLALVIALFGVCDCNTHAVESDFSNKKLELNKPISLLTKDEIPDIINYNDVINKGHFERVIDKEENLNTMVFNNIDGTQSCYIFNHPVKYIDESGKVKDKSMLIETDNKNSGFSSKASDIDTFLSDDLSDGIHLKYNNVNIKMIPDFLEEDDINGELSEDCKSVTYKCNDMMSLKYELTYQGFKENIVLHEYNGVNEFSFTLITNGLALRKDESEHLNLYDKTDSAVANIGEIIVFDSSQKSCIGDVSYQTIQENQEYTLTISVHDSFLTDESIVYPVYIDPTIEIDYYHYGMIQYDGGPAIQHCTISSDDVNSYNDTMIVGKKMIKYIVY